MQRPNRGAVLFVMPLAIFMLIIGWILLSAGSTKSKPNKNFYAKRTNFHIATQSTNLLA